MGNLNISDGALASENNLKAEVIRLHKDLYIGAKELIEIYLENRVGLGAHDGIILQLLVELAEDCGDSSKVAVLKKMLTFSVANRQKHKNEHEYKQK